MNVYIVGRHREPPYEKLWQGAGYNIVDNLEEADVVQFTGGEDISPCMYGEMPHPMTSSSEVRDGYEVDQFNRALRLGKAMVGICRGGQFLNVINGGRMIQHCTRHGIAGTHPLVDLDSGREVDVTSTHHQMMIPHNSGTVIAEACLGGIKEIMVGKEITRVLQEDDCEVVYYPETNCLCFQPHPEFVMAESTKEYFFEVVGRTIGNRL